MRARLFLLSASLLTLTACHRQVRPPSPSALCTLALPARHAHTSPAALPASLWLALLIRHHDRLDERGASPLARDAVDCAGEPIGMAPLPSTCPADDAGPAQLLPPNARTQALVLRHAGGAHWFAWAPLWRRSDGTAEGPLAIARRGAAGLEVRAIGSVRGYPQRARIGVHRVASRWVLGVEGEHCASPGRCVRAVRLAYLERLRFRDRPLRAASTHACVAPAWLPLHEEVLRPLGAHGVRGLRRELAVAYEPDAIIVDEHIVVRDRDARHDAAPSRLFREAQSRLRIRPEGGELLTEGQSLWDAIRARDAALDVEAP
ncbi:MAG: hypothetical protein ABW252_25030 [Polyangiales bacterium]